MNVHASPDTKGTGECVSGSSAKMMRTFTSACCGGTTLPSTKSEPRAFETSALTARAHVVHVPVRQRSSGPFLFFRPIVPFFRTIPSLQPHCNSRHIISVTCFISQNVGNHLPFVVSCPLLLVRPSCQGRPCHPPEEHNIHSRTALTRHHLRGPPNFGLARKLVVQAPCDPSRPSWIRSCVAGIAGINLLLANRRCGTDRYLVHWDLASFSSWQAVL